MAWFLRFATVAGQMLASVPAGAAILTVGPGQPYATIAAAIGASHDGDTVSVTAGTYTNDFAEITTRIALVATGGRVTMQASGYIPNQKGILITDTDISITGFNFVGARVTDAAGANGAGIRYQAGHLTLSKCFFHNNQNGLLGNPDPAGIITIIASEFAHNGNSTGPGAGYTHNLYAGAIALLDIEGSYFHDANVGHEIKSRAAQTIINATRVVDGRKGTASYSVDLPNGGLATITASSIEQGARSDNPVIITFGEEGGLYAGSALTVRSSLIENDLTAHVPIAVVNDATSPAAFTSNEVYGLTADQLVSGPSTQSDTMFLPTEPKIPGDHPF